MRHRTAGAIRILVGCAGLVAAAELLSSCSATIMPAAGELVPATSAQFEPAVTVAVLDGSGGMESAGPGDAHWWFTSPSADISVSNNSAQDPTVELSATITAPPCPGDAQVALTLPGGRVIQLRTGTAGKAFSAFLDVPVGHVEIVHVSIFTSACHLPTDPRPLYAGLFTASVRSVALTSLSPGSGLTNEQDVAPAPSLYWLTSSTAELSVRNNGVKSARLRLSGYVIPPPCAGAVGEVSVEPPGVRPFALDTRAGPAEFALSLSVPQGAATVVRFRVSSKVCRIATDDRTFYAGLLKLAVSAN